MCSTNYVLNKSFLVKKHLKPLENIVLIFLHNCKVDLDIFGIAVTGFIGQPHIQAYPASYNMSKPISV